MVRDDLEALRVQSQAFESFSEYSTGTLNLHGRSSVERVTTIVSDRDLFDVLGARTLAGRTFRDDDQLVAVLSEPLWRARFAGDPDAIGQQVTLDDRSFTVVGVMPEAFQFPYGAASVLRGAMAEARVDVWIAEYRPLRGRLSRLVARLKPGATQAAAAAEIAAVEARRRSLNAGAQTDGTRIGRALCRRRARAGSPIALAAFRGRCARPDRGVRKRREPASGAYWHPDAGGRHASGARRIARTARASVPD